jgi:hypothetical protein
MFIPVSIAGGMIAGLIGRRLFAGVWRLVDDQEPPEPDQREASWPKLIAALALEGAIFRAISGATDHASRRSFYRATGAWPGEEPPEESDPREAV